MAKDRTTALMNALQPLMITPPLRYSGEHEPVRRKRTQGTMAGSRARIALGLLKSR